MRKANMKTIQIFFVITVTLLCSTTVPLNGNNSYRNNGYGGGGGGGYGSNNGRMSQMNQSRDEKPKKLQLK
jgi:hypothetical protein